MKFAANLGFLFTEHAAEAGPELAWAAGFDGIEAIDPYVLSAEEWQRALGGFPVALINTPFGDRAGGARGFAAVPGAETQFRSGFARALDHAAAMGAERLHVLAGNAAGSAAEACYRRNLEWAAGRAAGLPLVIEPLNMQDMPGYFLNDFNQAAQVIADLALPNLGLQFDMWHAVRLHGDAAAVWKQFGALADHIQIAGAMDRAEPVDAAPFLRQVQASGYQGWVGAEYRPRLSTTEGLVWLAAMQHELTSTPMPRL